VGVARRLRRREGGLSTATLSRLLTSGLYVDRALLRDELGVGDGDIDEALRETVAASARRPSR